MYKILKEVVVWWSLTYLNYYYNLHIFDKVYLKVIVYLINEATELSTALKDCERPPANN